MIVKINEYLGGANYLQSIRDRSGFGLKILFPNTMRVFVVLFYKKANLGFKPILKYLNIFKY